MQYAFEELHLSRNSSQPALRNEKSAESNVFATRFITKIFVSFSPVITRSAWRTDETDRLAVSPSYLLHHDAYGPRHSSPLLNSVSCTPGFKPSRHAPVAWSKGGATGGTRPDLHLPPLPPPPPHTHKLFHSAGRSSSSHELDHCAGGMSRVLSRVCVPLHSEYDASYNPLVKHQTFVTAETKLHCA